MARGARALRKRSSDSRRAACVMLPCSSAAGGRPARPNRILARCAACLVAKKTIVRPALHAHAFTLLCCNPYICPAALKRRGFQTPRYPHDMSVASSSHIKMTRGAGGT
jgi:hypothetical protein